MSLYTLKAILNIFWFRAIILVILIYAITHHFVKYKKGVKPSLYYGRGFIFILIAYVIQILKNPLEATSTLNILGLMLVIIFLILGVYNISYLTSKKQIQNK